MRAECLHPVRFYQDGGTYQLRGFPPLLCKSAVGFDVAETGDVAAGAGLRAFPKGLELPLAPTVGAPVFGASRV